MCAFVTHNAIKFLGIFGMVSFGIALLISDLRSEYRTKIFQRFMFRNLLDIELIINYYRDNKYIYITFFIYFISLFLFVHSCSSAK